MWGVTLYTDIHKDEVSVKMEVDTKGKESYCIQAE